MGVFFDEAVYFGELGRLHAELHRAARCRALLDCLAARGVPAGSVIYSRTVRRHRDRTYSYTNEFLYIAGCKFYISKKYPYPPAAVLLRRPDAGLSDPADPDVRLLLRDRLRLRGEYLADLKHLTRAAKRRCAFLNANKSRSLPRIDFDDAFDQACADLRASAEWQQISDEVDRRLAALSAADNASSFSNEIFNENGERLRSKNEYIVTSCARSCGFSLEIEPPYPGTPWRADLKLRARGHEYLVEIAGRRDDPAYERRLQEKQTLARRLGLSLITIDMTDYPDSSGQCRTRLYGDKLRRFFQKLCAGIEPEGIVTPY